MTGGLNIKVMKFGGTSVATPSSRDLLADKVVEAINQGFHVAVVVSAMGRLGDAYATDSLLGLLSPQTPENAIERDLLMSCGETITSAVVTNLLKARGIKALPLMGFQAGIITDEDQGDANVIDVHRDAMLHWFSTHQVLVIAGFQGISQAGLITTLGRGGSDYSAAVLGVALDAQAIEIYTDVDGVMTADPRVVDDARVLTTVSHTDIHQMALDGAKVVDHKAVDLAMRHKKALYVKNTFSKEIGTLITSLQYDDQGEYIQSGPVFTAITSKSGLNQITLKALGLNLADINVLMAKCQARGLVLDFTQTFSHKQVILVHDKYLTDLLSLISDQGLAYDLLGNLSKVTGISGLMGHLQGVGKSVLKALSNENIEIIQTYTSTSAFSCVVETDHVHQAVNVLHRYYAK